MKQLLVKYNKIKAQAGLIVVIMLILVAIAGVVIVSNLTLSIVKSPPTISCIYYAGSSIDKACYLNKEEIKIIVNKDPNPDPIEKIGFIFTPSNAKWELTGKRCTDAKIEGRDYNNYCRILLAGERMPYIFNTSDIETQEKVTVYF